MALRLGHRIIAQVEVAVGVEVEAVIAFACALALIDGKVGDLPRVRLLAVQTKVNRAIDRFLRFKGRIRFNLWRRLVVAFPRLAPEKAILAIFKSRNLAELRSEEHTS